MDKFRIQENIWLTNTYSVAEQIRERIVAMCEENSVLPINLPPSAISTDNLLKIVTGFVLLFDKLQEQELIDASAVKNNRKIH